MTEGKVFVFPWSTSFAGAGIAPAITKSRDAALRPFRGRSTTLRCSTTSLKVEFEVLIWGGSAVTETVWFAPPIANVKFNVAVWSASSLTPLCVDGPKPVADMLTSYVEGRSEGTTK